jgi:hypothetical protein
MNIPKAAKSKSMTNKCITSKHDTGSVMQMTMTQTWTGQITATSREKITWNADNTKTAEGCNRNKSTTRSTHGK